MAQVGGCYCGKCRIEYTDEPVGKAICHCLDCRKISGSTYSTNILVPEGGFKVTSGQLKSFTVKADSGNDFTSYFCPECGSTLYREGPTFKGLKVVKVGVMDDPKAMDAAKPGLELYSVERVGWVAPVEGAEQKTGMP